MLAIMESNVTLENITDSENGKTFSNEDLIKVVWITILIIAGTCGNLLTLLAIPFAQWKGK